MHQIFIFRPFPVQDPASLNRQVQGHEDAGGVVFSVGVVDVGHGCLVPHLEVGIDMPRKGD